MTLLGIFIAIGLVFAAPLAFLPAFVRRGRADRTFRWATLVAIALLVTLITHVGYTYVGARVSMIFQSIGSCDTFDATTTCSLAPPEPEYNQHVRELWLRRALPPVNTCYSDPDLCKQVDQYVATGTFIPYDWGQFMNLLLYSAVAGIASGWLLWWRTRPVHKRKNDE